jgi:hypothetical protein
MNEFDVGEGTKEMTITYKESELNSKMLDDMINFVLDCYNEKVPQPVGSMDDTN